MKINILHFIEGAKKAQGLAVIIDVFRAFSFECYAIRRDVKRIIPVASKELAYELKEKNPDYILAGERNGVMLPGFDFGNSPAQIEYVDLSNKIMVHTTSAGTQGLENAMAADQIITGSLVNAKAVANYIESNNFDEVSLVCMGNNGVTPAREDEICAEYIKSLLENTYYDIDNQITALKANDGRKFFDSTQKEIFPIRDFYLCTAVDSFDFVLKFAYDSTGLGYIEKQE